MTEITTTIKAKDGKVVIHRVQAMDPILDAIKEQRASVTSWRPFGSGRKDQSIRHVAELPCVLVEQWMKEGINIFSPDPDMQKKFRQKLNSPEYAYLRTFPGKVRVTGK